MRGSRHGSTRRFEVHPKSGVKRLLSLPMPNNSLLIMGDEMQLHYSVQKLNRRELKLCATCADIRRINIRLRAMRGQ
eukprot:g65738.t1